MDFKEFRDKQQVHIRAMLNETLFTTEVDKDEMWYTYLDSFPPGTNEIFRQRREFDCSCCRNFIINFGNVVMVKDGQLVSIWAFETNDTTYQPMLAAWGKWSVVGIVNWRDQTTATEIDLEKMGLDPVREYHVYNFWHRRYAGIVRDSIRISSGISRTKRACAVVQAGVGAS